MRDLNHMGLNNMNNMGKYPCSNGVTFNFLKKNHNCLQNTRESHLMSHPMGALCSVYSEYFGENCVKRHHIYQHYTFFIWGNTEGYLSWTLLASQTLEPEMVGGTALGPDVNLEWYMYPLSLGAWFIIRKVIRLMTSVMELKVPFHYDAIVLPV